MAVETASAPCGPKYCRPYGSAHALLFRSIPARRGRKGCAPADQKEMRERVEFRGDFANRYLPLRSPRSYMPAPLQLGISVARIPFRKIRAADAMPMSPELWLPGTAQMPTS